MALAAFVAAVNRLQNAIDLEPILKHFGSSKRTLERELGFEALDLRLTAFIAIVFYTIPGLIMVVRDNIPHNSPNAASSASSRLKMLHTQHSKAAEAAVHFSVLRLR